MGEMCKRWPGILVSYLFSLACFAQTGEGRNDCTFAKEVVVPFTYSSNGAPVEKPVLNQTVFYNYREQFSYWYKIAVKENSKVSFQVKAINDSDEYVIYVYQYNMPDFCEKVFDQKIRELKPSFFTPARSDPYDLSERSFKAQKDNTYYICVLNISINNCGHRLFLATGTDTLKVKALHLPCERNIAALAVKDFKVTVVKKDSAGLPTNTSEVSVKKDSAVEIKPGSAELFCSVKNALKNILVDARIVVSELSTSESLSINMYGTGNCTGALTEGKTYQVRCSAFGYKNSSKTFTAVKGKNTLEIALQPYKAGENFVMKSIYFYPNTYALKKEASPELQKLLRFMQDNEALHIEIQGHTNGDNRVSKNKAYVKLGEEWNFQGTSKKLSEKRAETIKQFLLTNGIPAERIEAKGYGGKAPVIKDPQNNEEGQMNIRVEIGVLKS